MRSSVLSDEVKNINNNVKENIVILDKYKGEAINYLKQLSNYWMDFSSLETINAMIDYMTNLEKIAVELAKLSKLTDMAVLNYESNDNTFTDDLRKCKEELENGH